LGRNAFIEYEVVYPPPFPFSFSVLHEARHSVSDTLAALRDRKKSRYRSGSLQLPEFFPVR